MIASDKATLSNIVEREILITTLTYAVGATTVNTFDPWTLFFSNKRIINRINNFRSMFGKKLVLRFCVAASPFAYGKLIVAYSPLFTGIDNCTKLGTGYEANAIQLSQKHHIQMSITDGETHFFELPLIWFENTMDLQAELLKNLGSIHVYPLSALKQANGSTASITLTVFAHMEGIELDRPTTVNSFYLTNQSKETPTIEICDSPVRIASPRDVSVQCTCCTGRPKSFGRKTVEPLPFANHSATSNQKEVGTVSSTLESVSGFLGKAAGIPVVGQYASSGAAIASLGARVAQSLGYANPPDNSGVTVVVPRTVESLSHSTGHNDFSTLALDRNLHVSMDSNTIGFQDLVGTSITNICAKPVTFAKFTWNVSDAANALLWNARCHHSQGYWDGTYRYSTPAEFALMPFTRVRYSNCFTFEVVASKMHRGKLLVLYDPSYIAAVELNVLTGVIIDLGESGSTCTEVRIPWSQPKAFAYNGGTSLYAGTTYSTTAYTTADATSNGVIGVYVLNPLSSPSDSAGLTVDVIVHSKICDPKCYDPMFSSTANVSYINQSSESSSCDVADPDHSVKDIMEVFGGEVHDDILEILGKPIYSYTNLHNLSNSDYTKYYVLSSQCVRPSHPPIRGPLPANGQAIHTDGATSAGNANRVNTGGLNFYAPAYLGCRGGVRYLANYSKSGPSAIRTTAYVGKGARTQPLAPTTANADFSAGASSTSPDYLWNSATFQGHGASVNNCGTYVACTINPKMSWECPYVSDYRFRSCRDVKALSIYSLYGMGSTSGGYRTVLTLPSSGANTTFANAFVAEDIYTSKGEDYALFWFQGMPPWTLYST